MLPTRRAINQFVSRTTLANTMKRAATLTTTPSQVANHATTGFRSTLRLMISNTYRSTCTSAATPSTTIVAISVARNAASDGPERGAARCSSSAASNAQPDPSGESPRNGEWGPGGARVVEEAAPPRAEPRSSGNPAAAAAARSDRSDRSRASLVRSDARSTPNAVQRPTAPAGCRYSAGTRLAAGPARSTASRTGNTPGSSDQPSDGCPKRWNR